LKRVAVIGGETHFYEVTPFAGKTIEFVGAVVREDRKKWAEETLSAPTFTDETEMYDKARPEIIAIANENDLRAACVVRALEHGCDVIVDKPLAITMSEQEEVEKAVGQHPDRKLLMLLTLRATPVYAALRKEVRSGRIGDVAYCHLRMAVRLKRAERPPWFLDSRRSGGLFLDLLIHGLDQVEWITGSRIVAVTATSGNLGHPDEVHIRDHATVFCQLDNGGAAVLEGQRMLPDTKVEDFRAFVAGTKGYAELSLGQGRLSITDPAGADQLITDLPEEHSVVGDWLDGDSLVEQEASLRANRMAVLATQSAEKQERIEL